MLIFSTAYVILRIIGTIGIYKLIKAYNKVISEKSF